MEYRQFRTEFLEQVAARAVAEGDFKHSAFVAYSVQLLQDAEEVSDFEPCYFRGTGARKRSIGVDGFAFDDADGSVRLFIAEFGGGEEPETLTQTDAKSHFARLQAFCEEAVSGKLHREIEESNPAAGLAQLLFKERGAVTRFRLYLITDAEMSSRIRDWPESEISNIKAEFHIWDIVRFQRAFESRTGKDELEVDLQELVEGGVPCLGASVDSDEYLAYLCVIPGEALANIYDEYGSRLLEGNVRSFLSTKGRVNKGIRQTILTRPHMFFAFNNGIACTASKVDVVTGPSGLRITKASDLQIVNGGQTTASLAAAKRNDKAALDHVFVQMKLSVVPPERSGQVIPEISRCANSQNRVSDADFFSNHEFHRRIEQISRKLWAPAVGGAQHGTQWFYERARGQYLNEQSGLSLSDRKRFVLQHPRHQVIAKTDLAKYENAWRQLPHLVSQGAQKNFLSFSSYASDAWDKNEVQFNDEYFKRVVAKAILFRRTEQIVSKQRWYQGGYRANIVAYSISKLSRMIEVEAPGRALDFRSIWLRQALTPATETQIAKIAESVFDVIVNPAGGFQNITEWGKKELCWKRVAELEIPLDSTFYKELADHESDLQQKKDSAVDQKIEIGIEQQASVLQLGASYWKQIREFGAREGLLSPDDISILGLACLIPNKVPSEKQSSRLLQMKTRMESEGFPIRTIATGAS
ncbi:AIPR family protein [Candidatus Korobacter versatilis]|uniref:AIPR family protein n=1 Tax=Candidatus Korobacter versatilis TaxID=658062 RepID=UPI0002EF611F|nr:AIPR family protein [Candidatus Koribacter versatilis]